MRTLIAIFTILLVMMSAYKAPVEEKIFQALIGILVMLALISSTLENKHPNK